MQQLSSSTSIVKVQSSDQFGDGLVDRLAQPGRGATGFDFSIATKWLELLIPICPRSMRIAVLHDPTTLAGIGFFQAIKSAAPPVGLEVSAVSLRGAGEIERGVIAFARRPAGALIVVPDGLAIAHRELIIALAAKYHLPAIYGLRFFVNGGGLLSYEIDALEQFRRAARYIHRILNGEKAADLAVQAATKYTLLINLQTARMLGLTAPTTLFTALTSALA
jgi:putative tryptophan/tyrosine transport system substrate-binding protein